MSSVTAGGGALTLSGIRSAAVATEGLAPKPRSAPTASADVKRVTSMEISYQPLFTPNPRIRDPRCFDRRTSRVCSCNVQRVQNQTSKHPAGEPRTYAIPFDCSIGTRKRRARCCTTVTVCGGRVINVATPRFSAVNRDVARAGRRVGGACCASQAWRRRRCGLIHDHQLYTIIAKADLEPNRHDGAGLSWRLPKS